MGIEGRLDISFQLEEGRIWGVDIASSRPLRLSSHFVGKSPQDVLALIPSLYSICGMAQMCAAVRAFEQALGIEVPSSTQAAREMAVHAETAREHLLRLVMMVGQPSAHFSVSDIMPLAHDVKTAVGAVFEMGGVGGAGGNGVDMATHIDRLEDFLARAVFGEPLREWRGRQNTGAFEEWIAGRPTDAAVLLDHLDQKGWRSIGGDVALHGLPPLDDAELLKYMKKDGFIAFPTWLARPCETTPLARQADEGLILALMAENKTGLMTRLGALLVELAGIPTRIRELIDGAKSETIGGLEKGVGLAQVEAARGRLAHAVWMEKGLVADYRILAPTEWNFHPQGVAAQALKTLSFAPGDVADLKAKAEALISAIDPCVATEVRIT